LAKALIEFEMALELDPNLPEVYYGLGVIYKLQGEREKAIEAFERFLEVGPGQDPQAKIEAERQLEDLKRGGASE
jgi:tetratricopeptide (TPR) repeat protein